jgi:ATP-dependent Lon protease
VRKVRIRNTELDVSMFCLGTMACALISLALAKSIKRVFAMTGELTLIGQVYPVVGIREKLIAAKRQKIKRLVLPRPNERDVDELPAYIRHGLDTEFTSEFTSEFKDVLAAVF